MRYREFEIIIKAMKQTVEHERAINETLEELGLLFESSGIDLLGSPAFKALEALIKIEYPKDTEIVLDLIYEYIYDKEEGYTIKDFYDDLELKGVK